MSFRGQNDNIASMLSTINAFNSLSDNVLVEISPLLIKKIIDAPGIILSSGDNSTEVYFIVSGLVRATMYSPSGREVSYQDIYPGDMFGEMTAIDQMCRSTHVIAIEDTVLLRLSSKNFIDLISTYPSVGLATLVKITKVNRFLCERIYEFSALDVNHRIRAELIRLAKGISPNSQGEVTIENMPKHQELANRLATHREAVTRELNRLEKDGVIKKNKSKGLILDIQKLESMVWS
jgi:CRP/FNR family cyclic AMP-dependent transcriptional regulator